MLLNGRRSVASTITGVVDVNTIPQMLVERVEVVTGGASAAYGSDAVAGVVNFILDNDFEGLRIEARHRHHLARRRLQLFRSAPRAAFPSRTAAAISW